MSFYRNVVWFSKGFKEYTRYDIWISYLLSTTSTQDYYFRGGYEAASKNFKVADLDVDCSGKSFMITGGNSGIGKCIASKIAARGGTVHLVCRNKTTAKEAQEEIQKETGNMVKQQYWFVHTYKSSIVFFLECSCSLSWSVWYKKCTWIWKEVQWEWNHSQCVGKKNYFW